jgi:hypothetical protein
VWQQQSHSFDARHQQRERERAEEKEDKRWARHQQQKQIGEDTEQEIVRDSSGNECNENKNKHVRRSNNHTSTMTTMTTEATIATREGDSSY